MRAKFTGTEETMTPQERKLVSDLFDRLEKLEDAPRDDAAVDVINQGLDRAPNALYPLVQTVLVQDEALKRADARIRELESELGVEPPQAPGQGGFLDDMRGTIFGRREQQGSVPSVRPGAGENKWGPAYNQSAGAPQGQPAHGQPGYGQPPPQPSGGSFLGTAAATAAGVVGGALLMQSFRGMFGGQQGGQSHSAFDQPSGGAPWGSGASGSDLAREAGLGDVGRGGRTGAGESGAAERVGLFDSAQNDADVHDADGDHLDGGDFDGGDFGGGDD
jgi:hypothetical protein